MSDHSNPSKLIDTQIKYSKKKQNGIACLLKLFQCQQREIHVEILCYVMLASIYSFFQMIIHICLCKCLKFACFIVM